VRRAVTPREGSPRRPTGTVTDEIDRAKLRAALRNLGDEYVHMMLAEALDLIPASKLAKLVAQYVDLKTIRAGDARKADLLAEVATFEQASLSGDFFESFNVNSKNYMEQSKGTRAWVSECQRLLDRLVVATAKRDASKMTSAFEVMFALLRRLEDGEDDMVFFADEGDLWRVAVDWSKVFGAYFACLAKVATPDDYARRVVRAITTLDDSNLAKHLGAARRLAAPAQRKAMAAAQLAPRKGS
jgi:hypothetical protein